MSRKHEMKSKPKARKKTAGKKLKYPPLPAFAVCVCVYGGSFLFQLSLKSHYGAACAIVRVGRPRVTNFTGFFLAALAVKGRHLRWRGGGMRGRPKTHTHSHRLNVGSSPHRRLPRF